MLSVFKVWIPYKQILEISLHGRGEKRPKNRMLLERWFLFGLMHWKESLGFSNFAFLFVLDERLWLPTEWTLTIQTRGMWPHRVQTLRLLCREWQALLIPMGILLFFLALVLGTEENSRWILVDFGDTFNLWVSPWWFLREPGLVGAFLWLMIDDWKCHGIPSIS